MRPLAFSDKFMVEDIWADIFEFLEPSDILLLRRVCRALSSITRLRRVWHSQLRCAVASGECANPASVDLIAAVSSLELERACLRSLAVERAISAGHDDSHGRVPVLPLCSTVCPGRPISRITWVRLLRGGCILQATSDGFLQCLSFSSDLLHRAELLGAWTGLGALTSGEVMSEESDRVVIAVATDLHLRIVHFEVAFRALRACSVGLTSVYSRPGPSGVFACSRHAVFSAFYEGRNLVHAFLPTSDLIVQLGVEEAPQMVHCGVATENLLLVVKDLVLDLYSMSDILSANSMFHQVLALKRFALPHMSWKAVATYLPDFSAPRSHSTFGVVVHWHDGLTFYTMSTTSDQRSPETGREFVLKDVSHLPLDISVGALSIGRSGYRVLWTECPGPGLSRLVSSRLSKVESLDSAPGSRLYTLTTPRCLWTGEPPGILDHCSYCSIDEASGCCLVSQTYSGVSWFLSYDPQHIPVPTTLPTKDNLDHVPATGPASLLADRLPDIIIGLYYPPLLDVQRDKSLFAPWYERDEMEEVTKDWYTIPSDLLPPRFSTSRYFVFHEWTNRRGGLRDLVRTAFHLPGTPKVIMHDRGEGATVFEVDGYFYCLYMNDWTWSLYRAVGCKDVLDFAVQFKEERVEWQSYPCESCGVDGSVMDANGRWNDDHKRVVAALSTKRAQPPVEYSLGLPPVPYDIDLSINSSEFCNGQEAARRLMLTVEPGIRRSSTRKLFEEDSEGRSHVHLSAELLNITIDSLHHC